MQSVEQINSSELHLAARVLAEAYAEDPIFLWAMSDETRLTGTTVLFNFLLTRKQSNRRVVATSDRAAIGVMVRVDRDFRERHGPSLRPTPWGQTTSPLTDFFRWVQTLRPDVEHYCLEFIACSTIRRSQGLGSIILNNLLETADQDGLPVWSWSSNPRNLNFYRRHDFDIGAEVRRDGDTPAVIPIWRPGVQLPR
jgi:GNAT superfamily N-acetyltransferase